MPKQRPVWVEVVRGRYDPDIDPRNTNDLMAANAMTDIYAILTLAEDLAEELGKMHSRYRHDPQCPVCAALARWEAGPVI